jgi:hypothetical protein
VQTIVKISVELERQYQGFAAIDEKSVLVNCNFTRKTCGCVFCLKENTSENISIIINNC